MELAYRIGFLARRYRLLSERPEFLTANRAELIERVLASPVTIGELDRSMILHASELDRLCAHAVRGLAQRTSRPVLDLLGVLSPERLAAMYYALPENRRAGVRRDPAWAYHVERVPLGTAEAVEEFEQLAEDLQVGAASLARNTALAPSACRRQAEDLERGLLRQEVGL